MGEHPLQPGDVVTFGVTQVTFAQDDYLYISMNKQKTCLMQRTGMHYF